MMTLNEKAWETHACAAHQVVGCMPCRYGEPPAEPPARVTCGCGSVLELERNLDFYANGTWRCPTCERVDSPAAFSAAAKRYEEKNAYRRDGLAHARIVEIDYTNHRGERRVRKIIPCPGTLRFTSTPHHPSAQWVMNAWDVERDVERTFAFATLHNWRPT